MTIALTMSAMFAGCGDDENKEPEKVPAEMVLDAPADGATADMSAEEWSDGIEFKWLAVEGVTSYLLEVSTKADFDSLSLNITGNQLSYFWPSGTVDAELVALDVDYEETVRFYWRVTPVNAEDFSEVIPETRSLTVKRREHPGLYGEWLFDTEEHGKANVGNDLEMYINQSTAGTTFDNQFELVDGVKAGDRAVRMHANGWFICPHGIKPDPGDQYVSRYTLMFDVKFNDQTTYMEMCCSNLCWYGFGSQQKQRPDNCKYTGGNDIIEQCLSFERVGNSATNQIALSNATYLSSHPENALNAAGRWSMVTNKWYRVVLSVDLKLSPPRAEVWIDGVKRLYPTDTQINKFSPDLRSCLINLLPEGFILFCQQGEANLLATADFSVAAIWSYALPDAEIVALGVAGDSYQLGRE